MATLLTANSFDEAFLGGEFPTESVAYLSTDYGEIAIDALVLRGHARGAGYEQRPKTKTVDLLISLNSLDGVARGKDTVTIDSEIYIVRGVVKTVMAWKITAVQQ